MWIVIALYAAGCCLAAGGYVNVGTPGWWRFVWADRHREGWCGLFRNDRCSRGYPSFKPGGRWGLWIVGFELGSRDSRDPLGCWLVDRGIWRW